MKVGDKVRVRIEVKTIAPKDETGIIESFCPEVEPSHPFYVYFQEDDTQWAFSEDELELI